MTTVVYFYIRENGQPTSLDDYSGQEVPAIEQGIHDLLDHSDSSDNYFTVDSYDDEESGWGQVTYHECVEGGSIPFPQGWLDKYVGKWWMLNDPKEMCPLLPQYGLNPWKQTVEVFFSMKKELPPVILPPPTGLERCIAAPSSSDRSPVSLVSSPIPENDSLRTELKKYMHRLAKRMGELEGKEGQKAEYDLCKKCWHHANTLLLEL